MDRSSAARLLGVPLTASRRQVDAAFRRAVRTGHPDRFPPGSEAYEEATSAMVALTEARRTMTAGPAAEPGGLGRAGASTGWVSSTDLPPRDDDPVVPPEVHDRRMMQWGLGWGGFLVASAVVSFVVGSTAPTNDALPLWSPALLLIGLACLVVGWRARGRLPRSR